VFPESVVNSYGGVMVSVLALNAIDHGFEARVNTKPYDITIYCFSANHAALRNKSKD
jgi:hypothetical protein